MISFARGMAEIDTNRLESVQTALTFFEQKFDQNMLSPNRNEEENDFLTKELANGKLRLEVKENENWQANLKLETLQKTIEELSDNSTVTSQQSEKFAECKALKDELVRISCELHNMKESNVLALKQAELMEARMIMERENTKEALMRILQLNETVLSSALAAVRAEEERSVFFQEMTLGFFMSDEKLETIKRQLQVIEGLENEMLAKTVEIDYLQSELQHVKELYTSSKQVSHATENTNGDAHINDRAHKEIVKDQEPQEVAFPDPSSTCFIDEVPREDNHAIQSDEREMACEMSENVVENEEPKAEVVVPNLIMVEENSDAALTCFVTEIPREEIHTIQSADKNVDTIKSENNAGNEEPQAKATAPNSTECNGNSEAVFISESSREDFQSVHSDDDVENIHINTSENIEGTQEPQPQATAPNSTECKGNNSEPEDLCHVTETSREENEFYTKEFGQDNNNLNEDVFVAKKNESDTLKNELDAARSEISDLKFSLEEAVRRAELAEEAKAAMEDQLKEHVRKRRERRRASSERARTLQDETPTMRPTPSWKPATPKGSRSAPRGDEKPLSYVTLGQVLCMKYK